MKIAEYRTLTVRTLPDLGSDKLNYSHMVMGLSGEIGELVECIGTELKLTGVDRVNLGEEIGDIYWYLSNYCNMREIDLPEETISVVEGYECLDFLITSISNLVDIVKKYVAYNKPIEKSKEMEATYDIRSALFLMESVYELNGGDIRSRNIHKLKVRYPEKFDENLAVNRKLDEERKTLE